MKTTIDIPDEVVSELREQASRTGRDLAEHIVQVVRIGLIIDKIPAVALEQIAHALGSLSRRSPATGPRDVVAENTASAFSADPATGLLMIDSPPDAPVRSMTPDQVLAMTDASLAEDDLERARLSV